MATRLYFSSSQSAPQSLGFANWANVNSVTKRALLESKVSGDDLTLGTRLAFSAGSLACDGQFVSPSIVQTFEINGQVHCQLNAREFNNGDNTVTAMAARIVTASGTLRGTLLAATKWFGPTSELINNATLRNMAFASGTVITSVTALPNDRLVLEIGFGDNSGATPEGQARYGADTTSEAAQNMSDTTSGVGWFEFANTYLLFTLPGTVREQSASDNLHASDDRMSMLGKNISIIQPFFEDANLFGRFMVLSESQSPISDVAAGVIHSCVANVFATAIRNRHGIDTIDLSDNLTKLLKKIVADALDLSDAIVTEIAGGLQIVLRELSDTLDVSDGFRKLQGMNQQEAQATTESFAKMLAKVMEDNRLTVTDLANSIKILSRSLADNVDLLDAISKKLFKQVGDLGVVADLRASSLFKNIGDAQLTSDSTSKLLKKVLSERADVSDTAVFIRAVMLVLLDAAHASDDYRKMLAKSVGDLGSIVDNRSSQLSKSIGDRQDVSDLVSINAIVGLILLAVADSLSLSDNQRKSLFKNVGDLSAFSDMSASLLSKSLADRQDASDLASLSRISLMTILDSLNISDAFSKALFKRLADDTVATDLFAKSLTKLLGDNASARDEFASQFSKAIGDSQGARDLLSLALSKTIAERQDVSDTASLIRYLRRLASDDIAFTDSASASKVTNQLILEVLEAQDVSDVLFRQIIKVVGDNAEASDAVTLATILGTPIVKYFIDSMLAGDGALDDKATGAKGGFGMVVDDKSPQGIVVGNKGRRQK